MQLSWSSVEHFGAKVPLHPNCENPLFVSRGNSPEKWRNSLCGIGHLAESYFFPLSTVPSSVLWEFLLRMEGLLAGLVIINMWIAQPNLSERDEEKPH